MNEKDICIIGYGGHSYVALEILQICEKNIIAYCENTQKENNPFNLKYLGMESSLAPNEFNDFSFFIGIGDNKIRGKVFDFLKSNSASFVNAIHPSSNLSKKIKIGEGVMISAGATINPFVTIGNAVICNTQCSIDHECFIGDYSHIAPGAILCGNVTIGNNCFIGAGSTIKQGIRIGNNVLIGAGSVVINDIPDNTRVAGCPAKQIKSKHE